MRIALLQSPATVLEPEKNLSAIAEAAAESAQAGAELLVTPELFTHGYHPQELKEHVTAHSVSHTESALSMIAKDARINLVASLPGSGDIHARGIDALLFGTTGEILTRYTKNHLYGPDEKGAFQAGNALPEIVTIGDLKVAILICYDVEFPETVRHLALAGVDAVLVPTALADEFAAITDVVVRARAVENQISVAYANHVGVEGGLTFDGNSQIISPEGEILAHAGHSIGIITADIGPRLEPSPEEPGYLHDLRQDLYHR